MSKAHKICHISILHKPFDPRIFYRECYSLNIAGYETHLIIPLIKNSTEIKNGIILHNNRDQSKETSAINLAERLSRLWCSLKISRSINADLYHLHDPELIPVGLLLKLFNKKIIFDSHENNTAYIMQKAHIPFLFRHLLKIYLTIIEFLAAKFFDEIITADNGVKELFIERYHANEAQVIHNFPRLDLFTSSSALPVNERLYDIVYHGSIPKSHLETAFAIDDILRERKLAARWLFFGACSHVSWALGEIKKRGIEKSFVIDPHLIPADQVVDRVCQAKIGFIPLPDLPKFHDNIPSKLFEFMALGLPVVMSDLPPSRPFVGDGSGVIMVPPGDYEAYANAIISLLSDPALYAKKAAQGVEKVNSNFSWHRESIKLINLYERILQKVL